MDFKDQYRSLPYGLYAFIFVQDSSGSFVLAVELRVCVIFC